MGKAKNLRTRVSSYFTNKNLGEKTKQLVSKINAIKAIETYSEVNSLILEARLIKKYQPYYNTRLTDGKAYQYIRITIGDTYPKVLTSRRIDDKTSLYFGPFPSSKSLKLVLSTIRKIFPFQSVQNHPNSICLYNHLGLCPCPQILKDKSYKRKNIKQIIRFLNGQNKKILKELATERNRLSEKENFEEASLIQKKINAILLITSPENKYFDYETNPNLSFDIKQKELSELNITLSKNGYKIKSLKRIECFDISNTSGTNTVGSMVVFKDGVEEKSEYRKFKIRRIKKSKQNDYLAIGEILGRRLMHKEWKFPNLIIIDGGKGQVTAVLNILRMSKIQIPVIGLAKREEIIITEKQKEIKLKYNSPALMLLKRVRDEAHRFAINYHRNVRNKTYFGKMLI